MEILRAYGVPVEIVGAVNMIYSNTTAQMLSPDRETKFFELLAGALQGDTLAPYLFIIALDYAMRQAFGNESYLGVDRSRSRRHQVKVISDTDFADDIALLSNTFEQAKQGRLDSTEIISKRNILSSTKVKKTPRRLTMSLYRMLTTSFNWDHGLIAALKM